MSDNESSDNRDLKSKLNDSIESVKSGAIKSSKAVAEASKKAADSTAKFAADVVTKISAKKEEVLENRKRKKAEFIESLKEDEKYKQIIVTDEKLPPMVTIPATEHEEMLGKIRELENEVHRLEEKLGEAERLTQSVDATFVEDVGIGDESVKEGEKGLTGEVNRSINQILLTLGFSVIWAIVLIVATFQLENRNINFSGLGAKAIVWPLGTAIWTIFLLTSQSKAGTLLSMDLKNRFKTAVGVGLATILSLMLTDGEMRAITNIWGWAMTVALCAFLLSGFFRGLFSSFRKITNKFGA